MDAIRASTPHSAMAMYQRVAQQKAADDVAKPRVEQRARQDTAVISPAAQALAGNDADGM